MNKAIPTTLPGRILLAALILGFAWDRLFYGQEPGLSLFLFLLLLLGTLGWLGQSKGIRPRRRNLWLVVPLFGMALLVALRAESGLRLLNLLAVLSLLGLLAHFYSGGEVRALTLFDYPALLAQVVGHVLVQAGPLVPQVFTGRMLSRHSRDNFFPLLRGVLLALPLLAFFALLFFAADPVFAGFVDGFFSLDLFDSLLEGTWRGLLILAVAWVLAGGLSYTLLRARADAPLLHNHTQAQLPDRFSPGFGEAATIMVLVNTLFATFVWIQFAYLFGGRAHLVLEGFTYAEYARHGFSELVTVALTTLALIRGLQWLCGSISGRQLLLFNTLSNIMLALVLVILISAFQRLRLYEAAFGYTRLRLMVHLFIIWLGLLLGWQAITLWYQRGRSTFALATMAVTLGFLVTLNALNPDALVARQNLARYRQTGKLDAVYLAQLSADAVPTLVAAVADTRGHNRETLCYSLRWQQQQLTQADESWTSFNLGRWRARHALKRAEWQALCPPLEPRS